MIKFPERGRFCEAQTHPTSGQARAWYVSLRCSVDVSWFLWLTDESISRENTREFPVLPREQEGQKALWIKAQDLKSPMSECCSQWRLWAFCLSSPGLSIPLQDRDVSMPPSCFSVLTNVSLSIHCSSLPCKYKHHQDGDMGVLCTADFS